MQSQYNELTHQQAVQYSSSPMRDSTQTALGITFWL